MLKDDWKNIVMYQILPRVFKDANGDGIGDLNGIINKLDYLKDLGIGGIWLMPFYRTHGADEGYDVEDYYTVRSQYGTNEDLKKLIQQCHKRRIKIIIDLVLNHTSNVHKWFLDDCLAENKDKASSYYLWNKGNPQWYLPYWWKISNFQTWNKNPWQDDGMYYYSAFSKTQPDLNYHNPRVLKEVKRIMKHYLDLGVDGFRMDAVRYMVEEKKGVQADTQGTHKVWQELKKLVDTYENRLFMGECFTTVDIIKEYVSDKEFDTCVNFGFAYALKATLLQESPYPLMNCVKYIRENFPNHLPDSPFAVNHDEVNDRFASLFNNFMPKIKIGQALLILSCGIPYIYYGEEIGMQGKADGTRRGLRRIMQWDDTRFAGFSGLDNINVESKELDLDIANCIIGALLDRNDNIRFWTKRQRSNNELYVAGTFNDFKLDRKYPLFFTEDNLYVSDPYPINQDIFEDDLFKFYSFNKKHKSFSWIPINPHISRDRLALPDSNLIWDNTNQCYNYKIKFQTTGFKRPFMLNRNFREVNVKKQVADKESLFSFIKKMIKIKKTIKAFDYDAYFIFLHSTWNHEKLFAYKKIKQEAEAMVIINLHNEKITANFNDFYFRCNYINFLKEGEVINRGKFIMNPYEIKILGKADD